MAQTDMSRQLAQAPVPRLLLRLSLPAIAAQLVNALYSIVDRVFIGNMPGVGVDALTGLGFTMPVIMIISAFSMLIGMGGSPLLSIRLGEGDEAAAAPSTTVTVPTPVRPWAFRKAFIPREIMTNTEPST